MLIPRKGQTEVRNFRNHLTAAKEQKFSLGCVKKQMLIKALVTHSDHAKTEIKNCGNGTRMSNLLRKFQ